MGLNVGMVGAKKLLGAVARQVLGDIHKLAAAVVALAGVALGILVGQRAAHGRKDGLGHEILTGDQLQMGFLPRALVLDGLPDFRVRVKGLGNVPHGSTSGIIFSMGNVPKRNRNTACDIG